MLRPNGQAELVWPPPPNPMRAKYLGEISSFVQTGKSLKTAIFGKGDYGAIIKPVAVSVGMDGRIAIADPARGGVHLFVPQEQRYQLLRGDTSTKLVSPVSVAFVGRRLFVSDSELNKVLIFNQKGGLQGAISSAGSSEFRRPTGLAYNDETDQLYVVDTLANKVHIFSGVGKYIESFGARGTLDGEFNMPTHITLDRNGLIYVTDAMNFRLQVFKPSMDFIKVFGHHGNGSGDFAMPKGVAVDRKGIIYVVETLFDLIQVFGLDGEYLLSIGSKGQGPGEFWLPSGLFIDRNNKLYVCDTFNNRIQLFQLMVPGMGGD